MDIAIEHPIKYRRWLPYWAVLGTDIRQTARSWVYRLWVILTVLVALGFLMYRFGITREAGIVQTAALSSMDLFRGIALASLALIVVLTVSSISSERGTLADSVLSRGISRYQYFLAKWHARSLVIIVTFILVSSIMLTAFHFLLADDLTLKGSAAAIVTVSALLMGVVALGVAFGALTNSSVIGITLLWILLYGSGILMTLVPSDIPTPEKALSRLPYVLRGEYNLNSLGEWIFGGVAVAVIAAIVGMIGFSRKDV
ncbi:MAG: ABC transporter permease [Zavarzinella sp.]